MLQYNELVLEYRIPYALVRAAVQTAVHVAIMAPKPERPTREGHVRTETSTSLVDYLVYDENLLPHQNADGLDVSRLLKTLQLKTHVSR